MTLRTTAITMAVATLALCLFAFIWIPEAGLLAALSAFMLGVAIMGPKP